jgi:arylsulfatase A-like enzyme
MGSVPQRQEAFTWVHFFDPHAHYEPPAPLDRLYASTYPGPFTVPGFQRSFPRLRNTRAGFTPRDLDFFLALYDGEIVHTDCALAELARGLDRLERLDRVLWILTSDHGEGFDHDLYFEHADRLYQSQLSVPLIWRGPGVQRASGPVAGRAALLDVKPTLRSLMGWRCDTVEHGIDLGDALRGLGTLDPARVLVAECEGRGFPMSVGPLSSLVEGRWKLIYRWEDQTIQLFDLEEDPGEEHDRATEFPAVAENLRHRLLAWVAETDRHAGEGAQEQQMDQETLEALRGLGYIQ